MKFLNLLKKNYISQFEVNHTSLLQTVRLFYGILAILPFIYMEGTIRKFFSAKQSLIPASYLWPVKWVSFFTEYIPIIVLTITIGSFLFSMVCVLFPYKKIFRLMTFLLFFQSIALTHSYVKITHSFHAILFTAFWLVFISLNKKEASSHYVKKQNKFYFWVTQVSILGTYFLSGLWKLRYFTSSLIEKGWSDTVCLESNFAASYNLFNFHNYYFTFFSKTLDIFEPGWGNTLWLGVIVFQISTLSAAWFPPLLKYYGIMIILFHMLTDLLMHIHFNSAQFLVLIILIGHPYLRKK